MLVLEQLQDILDGVPQDDTLGDCNARVDMYDPAEGLWHGTTGRHGNDERNSGVVRDFFSFVSLIRSPC